MIMLWGPRFWMSEEAEHQEFSSQARTGGKESNEFTRQPVILRVTLRVPFIHCRYHGLLFVASEVYHTSQKWHEITIP